MLSRWQSTIVDAQGNIQPFAILTVLDEATQTPAQIYASDSESQPLPVGVVVANEFGYAYFYARGGRYRIQSADLNIDWRHVQLGSASGVDAIGTAPLYGRDSVVGPVSHSGDIPTGALIQYGENPSGQFWRFAGGLQICARFVIPVSGLQGLDSAAFTFSYPAPFTSVEFVAANSNTDFASWSRDEDRKRAIVTARRVGNINAAASLLVAHSADVFLGDIGSIGFTAMGRWHN